MAADGLGGTDAGDGTFAHAVAVVNPVHFAILRITYYIFGTSFLQRNAGTVYGTRTGRNFHFILFIQCP